MYVYIHIHVHVHMQVLMFFNMQLMSIWLEVQCIYAAN